MSSLTVTTENQTLLLEAAAGATASTGWARDAQAVGYVDDEGLVAVAVFQNMSGRHADFHFAMMHGHRLNQTIAKTALQVAFHPAHLGLDVLWSPIPEQNHPAQIAALKMGFEFEARRRGYAADGGDVILMALRRDTVIQPPATASAEDETGPEEAA